jgi:hypothetical protein
MYFFFQPSVAECLLFFLSCQNLIFWVIVSVNPSQNKLIHKKQINVLAGKPMKLKDLFTRKSDFASDRQVFKTYNIFL